MSALVELHSGTLVHVAVSGLVTAVSTVQHLVADQRIVDALTIGAAELLGIWTGVVLGLRLAINLVRVIAAIVLPVASELLSDAFEVLALEFVLGALLVTGVAEFALVAAVTAVVVVIAEPALVQAATVVAGELVFGAGHRLGTVVEGHVLVGTVHAVGVAVAQPFVGDALRPVPGLVCRAGEFRFFIAFSVVALVTIVLVGVVETVVVAIADVDARYAVSVVAGEQVAKTGATLRVTVLGGLVAAVETVVVAIAVPESDKKFLLVKRYEFFSLKNQTHLYTRSKN